MSYDREFVEKLCQINLFIALFYVPAWLKSNIGMNAPINDLTFLHDMLRHKNKDSTVADTFFNKLLLHQWYLMQETVAFSFFSQHPLLINEMKESMAFQLLSILPPDEFCRGIPIFKRNIDRCSKLYNFIEPETWFLKILECLRMDKDWLYDKPEQWTVNESFKKAKNLFPTLKLLTMQLKNCETIFRLCCHFNRKQKANELVCCRLLKNIKNKLATLKN